MAGKSFWTKPRLKLLNELHAMGLSCSLVAAGIGFGCTRNAVIGKLSRLNPHAPPGAPTIVSSRRRSYTTRKRKAPIAVAPPPPPPPPTGPVVQLSLLQLKKHSCRWPLWSSTAPFSEKLFCSAYAPGVEERQPYCVKHTNRAKSLRY